MINLKVEAHRAVIYRLLLALIPVLGAAGWITDQQEATWMALALGVGNALLATLNTSTDAR